MEPITNSLGNLNSLSLTVMTNLQLCLFFQIKSTSKLNRLQYREYNTTYIVHMENYSFYKSSVSPLNDEIKFRRADSSQNSGEAAEGCKSNKPNFSFVGIIDKIYLLSEFVFRLN